MLRFSVLALLALCCGAAFAQYSNPAYQYGSAYGDYIQRMQLANVDNNSGASASPYTVYYSTMPVTLAAGSAYTITVTNGTYTNETVSAYIDYNGDGVFAQSAPELLGSFAFSSGGQVGAINFTVPAAPGAGQTRLRVICSDSSYVSGYVPPTISTYYGECEDYPANLGLAINTASPLPTGAVGSAYNTTITATNGTPNYNWVLPVSPLPAGLSASQSGNNLVISGTPSTAGTTNFTVTVNDSASPPKQAQKQFSITIVPPPAAMPFLDTFSTDKGWQPGSTWSRGAATAYSGTAPDRGEPGTDATASSTDNMILGDTIGGDYALNMPATSWAVSPMVNCTTGQNVRVRFQRWLGNAIGTSIYVEVSNNGTTWNNVWNSTPGGGQSTIRDTAWTQVSYDISAYANGYATVQVRIGVGPSGTTPHTGWCIDDFEIYDAGPTLEVKEGGTGGTVITDNQAAGGLRNFGDVIIGQQSSPLTISFTNNGSAPISFGTFTKSGANPADFTYQAGSMTNPLPVGQSTTFTIIFYVATGGSPGARTATISVPHNAGGTSFEINVMGNAISPQPGVIQVRETSATGTIVTFQQAAAGTARDFGNQDISAGPTAALTIFVVNTGAGTLTLSLPVMGGTWWNQYVLDTTGFQTTLAPAASTSFTVAFDPSAVQSPCDAMVRIAHNDTTQTTPFDVPVTGNGITTPTAPTVEVHQGTSSGPIVAHNDPATGTPRDFGNQVISAGPTAAITITIVSAGTVALTLGNPTLTGTQANQFVLNTTGFVNNLAAAASTSFTIAFDPSTVGAKTATVTFTHNDTTKTSPFIINVMGNGIANAPIVGVKAGGSSGATVTSGAPATGVLDFGNRDISGGPSAAVAIYIENTGTTNMTLGTPTLGGTSANQFVLDTTGYTTTVPPAGNTSFTIAFDPSTVGTKNASVSFTHNATGTTSSPFVVNVKGVGILNAPVVEVREGTVTGATVASSAVATSGGGRDLGSIDISAGATAAKVLVIRNTGTQPLTLGTPTLTGPDATQFALNTTGFTASVAVGANTQVSVTFDPTVVGVKDANIEFTHNDTGAPSPYIVRITGTATSPTGVTISTPSLPTGDQGQPYAVTLAATQGTAPYTWSLRNSTLPAGLVLSATGDITGTPTSAGLFTVTIRVTESGGGTNDKTFSLAINGNGLFAKSTRRGSSCAAESGTQPGVLALALLAVTLIGLRLRRRTA